MAFGLNVSQPSGTNDPCQSNFQVPQQESSDERAKSIQAAKILINQSEQSASQKEFKAAPIQGSSLQLEQYSIAAKIVRFAALLLANLLPTKFGLQLFEKGWIPLPTNCHEFAIFPACLAQTIVLDATDDVNGMTSVCTTNAPGSQGLHTSPGGSRILFHDSTIPESEYITPSNRDYIQFRNTNRGGIGKKHGFNFGVVCNGEFSGSTGLIDSQVFSESVLKNIVEHVEKINKRSAVSIFRKATHTLENGYITAVFASFSKTSDHTFVVHGASTAISDGDAVAIHLDRKHFAAEHLNKVEKFKYEDFKSDAIKSNPSYFSKEIDRQDAVILASAGLVNNIYAGQLNSIVPLIVFSDKFDESLEKLLAEKQSWLEVKSPLPNEEQMKAFIKDSRMSEDVDNVTIAKRLNKYLKLVTHAKTTQGKIKANSVSDRSADTFRWFLERTDTDESSKYALQGYRDAANEIYKEKICIDDILIEVLSPSGY